MRLPRFPEGCRVFSNSTNERGDVVKMHKMRDYYTVNFDRSGKTKVHSSEIEMVPEHKGGSNPRRSYSKKGSGSKYSSHYPA